jgi:hypothetical protein
MRVKERRDDMFEFFARMSFPRASWFLVILYLIHFLEEGPRLVEWFNANSLQKKFGLSYDQRKLNLENALMFSILLLIVTLFNIFPENALLPSLVLGACVAFLENVFFHVIPTLKTGVYSPGAITACLFNPIVFGFIFCKAASAHACGASALGIAFAFGTAILPGIVLLTHKVLLAKE